MKQKDIDGYARWTGTTAKYDGLGECDDRELSYLALGLGGETGEVLEHVKKLLRDRALNPDAIKKELGDVAWYWARLCVSMGFEPSEVLAANVEKLESRKARNMLHGSGDDR